MIHLNDSRVRRGSRTDRHEHIGAGAIGGDGLGHLLRHPRLAALPIILETPGMDSGWDAVNMARVRVLLAGRPLETLPPEAYLVARRRGPEVAEAAACRPWRGGARAHTARSTP